jgi:tetratricopeptide (TPR) repeat protein
MMLQAGRALFRSGLLAQAYRFFDLAQTAESDCAEAAACLGYVSHRLGRDGGAFFWLRRTLAIDPKYSEARIYLANMLYDRGESGAALKHLEKTEPEDHFDELGLWRTVELKKTLYRLADDDLELAPWLGRLGELAPDPDPTEDLLAEIEAQQLDGSVRDPNQLELFGALIQDCRACSASPDGPTRTRSPPWPGRRSGAPGTRSCCSSRRTSATRSSSRFRNSWPARPGAARKRPA